MSKNRKPFKNKAYLLVLTLSLLVKVSGAMAMSCDESSAGKNSKTSSEPKVIFLGDGKVRMDLFEKAMDILNYEKEFDHSNVMKVSELIADLAEKNRLIADSVDRVNTHAAEAFVHTGVILEKSERNIGMPGRPVFHVSTTGKHHLNRMARSLSKDLYGLKIRLVEDLAGMAKAKYSERFNEISLPVSLLAKFTITNSTVGQQLTHAINFLEGETNFGVVGVRDIKYGLPAKKGKQGAKHYSLDDLESQVFRFLALMAEYRASLLDKKETPRKQILSELKDLVEDLHELSENSLIVSRSIYEAFHKKGSLRIKMMEKSSESKVFFHNENILAYAFIEFNVKGFEYYYKVPIYKHEFDSVPTIESVTNEKASQEYYLKMIVEQKIDDLMDYILSIEALNLQIQQAPNSIENAKNKILIMEQMLEIYNFSRVARTGINKTDLIELFDKYALEGDDYRRYWGIEFIE